MALPTHILMRALKPEKCFWYLLDYTCNEGEWSYAVHSDFDLFVNNPDGSKSSIKQEGVQTSKKTLGIYDSPAGGNQGHLEYIHGKLTMWITRMRNGHLPSHMAWIAYKLQLWRGLRYGLGTMKKNWERQRRFLIRRTMKQCQFLGSRAQ